MDSREVHGVRRAITWLHEEARRMTDPHATTVLNNAAFHLGVQLKRWRGGLPPENRHGANVAWSDEDQAFVAVAPDLPGCCATGRTREEAIAELRDAMEAWLEAAVAGGHMIPVPGVPGWLTTPPDWKPRTQ